MNITKILAKINQSTVNFGRLYMSCIIVVTLHVPVYCVINNASIRLYQPNFKIHDVHVLRLTGRVIFSYTVRYKKRVVPMAIIRRKFSVSKHKSLSSYQQITEIPRFDILKQVHALLRCHAVFDVMNKQFIVCKHVSDSLVAKTGKPPSGRPRITTPLEVRS